MCEILENTSVNNWNYIDSSDDPNDDVKLSAEVLQSSSWVRGVDFGRANQFPFKPSGDVLKNIKLGIETEETYESSNTLTAFVVIAKKSDPQILSDKITSYQNLLLIIAYAVRFFLL